MHSLSMKSMALASAAVVGVGIIATLWTANLNQSSIERYEALRAEVPEEGELRQMLAESQYQVDTYREQIQHLEAGVPSTAYVPTLVKELEELGKLHNIEVAAIRQIQGPERRKKTTTTKGKVNEPRVAYREENIEMTGQGTYMDIMHMVQSLNEFPKIVSVETISLSPRRTVKAQDRQQSGPPVLEANIRIKVFVFSDANSNLQASTEEDKS